MVAKLPVAGDTLTIKQLSDPRFDKKLSVSRSGSRPWTRELDGNTNEWRVDGDTLLIEVTASWEMWFNVSYGLDIRGGEVLWDIIGMRRYGDKNFFVIEKISTNLGPNLNIQTFNLAIFDRKTRQLAARKFTIPERPGCGDPSDHVDDAEYTRSWFDARYLYARRKDACGAFTARFDWHGESGQRPFITAGR